MFVGLCLMWFTLLIWIINRPKWVQLLPLAGLLYIIFTLRYAALYLPAIALLTLLFSRRNLFFKLTGTVLMVLPLSLEVQRIKQITQKETGTAVFSAFGSWMAINNALHMYPYIEVAEKDLPSTECMVLNKIVKHFFDTLPVAQRPFPNVRVNYLWGSNSPMKTYMHLVQKQKKIDNYFNGWNAVAPVFSQYSNHLVIKHPGSFTRYFLWPNAKVYCLPSLESLLSYNEEHDTVDSTAIKWFKYKSNRVGCLNKTFQGTLLYPIPYWFLLVNIIFCGALVMLLVKAKRYALPSALLRTLLLAGAFWIVNFCFSIYAAPIVFRFELFPVIVFTAFSLLMINRLLIKKDTAA